MHIADIAKLGFVPFRSEEKIVDLGSRVALYGFRAKGAGLGKDKASLEDSDEPSVGDVINTFCWTNTSTGKRNLNAWGLGAMSAQVSVTPKNALAPGKGGSGNNGVAGAKGGGGAPKNDSKGRKKNTQPEKITVGAHEIPNPYINVGKQKAGSSGFGFFGIQAGQGHFGGSGGAGSVSASSPVATSPTAEGATGGTVSSSSAMAEAAVLLFPALSM